MSVPTWKVYGILELTELKEPLSFGIVTADNELEAVGRYAWQRFPNLELMPDAQVRSVYAGGRFTSTYQIPKLTSRIYHLYRADVPTDPSHTMSIGIL